MKTMIGIIDDYGMESFLEKDKENTFYFTMRASLNLHRNAKVYEVDMSDNDISLFKEEILNTKNWKHLAKVLQEHKKFRWIS